MNSRISCRSVLYCLVGFSGGDRIRDTRIEGKNLTEQDRHCKYKANFERNYLINGMMFGKL